MSIHGKLGTKTRDQGILLKCFGNGKRQEHRVGVYYMRAGTGSLWDSSLNASLSSFKQEERLSRK